MARNYDRHHKINRIPRGDSALTRQAINRQQFKVDHLTFELTDTTYAVIAGEAVYAKDRKPIFTATINKGTATELRRLAHQFDEREDKL